MEVVREGGTLLTVAQNGYGKRTELEEYRLQSRGGVGIINIQTSDRNGKVVGIAYVHDDDELMLISQQGMILRMVAGDIRTIGRATQGVRLIEMEEGDEVVVGREAGGEGRGERTARRRRRRRPTTARSADRQIAVRDVSSSSPTSRLGRLELRVLRQQLLHADRVEAHGDLQVVVVLLDRDHRPDAELRVPHAHARRAGPSPTGPRSRTRRSARASLNARRALAAPYGFVRNS